MMSKSAPYIWIKSPKLLDALGIFSPIVIGNHATLFFVPIIISRKEMSERTERHEAIHSWQQLECAFLGTLIALFVGINAGLLAGLITLLLAWAPYGFVFWSIYLASYLWNRIVLGQGGEKAYRNIIFEKEAYDKCPYVEYIESRPWFSWLF
jgi:hypothetical protein